MKKLIRNQKQQLLQSEMMLGLKPKEYWFDFKDHIDIRKLDKIEDFYSEKTEHMPEKLQMILVEERDKYGETPSERMKELGNHALRSNDPFSLDFLVNEDERDFLDYGEEIVRKVNLSEKEILSSYF